MSIKWGEISGIYEILNSQNEKKYIGSSSDIYSRIDAHKRALNRQGHRNPHLQNSWEKYGSENFKFKVEERIFNPTTNEIRKREQEYLDSYRLTENWDMLYNINKMATGFGLGEDNVAKREDVKEKISKAISGENHPFYGCDPEENPFYGKSHTEETRKKISENREHPTGEDHHMYGKSFTHSKETKKKMSESHKGKTWSDEVKLKISESNKGGKNPSTELTEDRVREIKTRYDSEDTTYGKLSEDYPVGPEGIGKIIRGERWTHVKAEED